MSDPKFLQQFSETVEALLQVIGADLPRSDENREQFSYSRSVNDLQVLSDWTTSLRPYMDVLQFVWELELQEGELIGNARLAVDGYYYLKYVKIQSGINPPVLDLDTQDTYDLLKDYLQSANASFLAEPMVQLLAFIRGAGGRVDLSIRLFIDKTSLTRKLALPAEVSALFYVSTEKLTERIDGKLYTNLEDLLLPNATQEIILLLGDCPGYASGHLNLLLGRAHWSRIGDYQPAMAERKIAADAVNFRIEECIWEISPSRLTPFHLFIRENALNHPGLYRAWMFLCAQACTTYLGNRTKLEGVQYCTEFKGYRSLKVCTPGSDPQLDYAELFGLFKWAYENSSSDKLGIVRQVLAPQLVGTALENFSILVKRSGSSRDEAKNNFDDYLRDKVDEYFAKRIQVIEFLQKFSDETGASVSKLASDLVGDLYKTVGVILGVILAALVDPKITSPVIYWTSMLYMIYVLFVTFYLLLSAYIRFDGKVRDHEFNIEKISSLLSDTEIERIQGIPFRRAKWIFRMYFALTEFVYLLLGGLAYVIMRSVAPYL